MILITAIPGGVTSNLMTYYAKGDLALSISLTSISTVISLVFTPLLLALYCADMPDINIPRKDRYPDHFNTRNYSSDCRHDDTGENGGLLLKKPPRSFQLSELSLW